MSNPFIPQLANKSTPVGADLLIIADSQSSNNEKNTTFTQVISNLLIVTEPTAITAGHIPVSNGNNTIVDSGIVVDHAQNLTEVGMINGIQLNTLLVNSNNLDDVSNKPVAFNNISPLSVKGDFLSFTTENVRVPIGANGYIPLADSSQAVGWKWAPVPAGGGGFPDNALFASVLGITLSTTLAPIPIDTILANTTGNLWTPNGDGFGMKCGTAGSYTFSGLVPIMHVGVSAGYVYLGFFINGVLINPNVPYFITGVASVMPIYVQAQTFCAVNDVITIQAFTGNTAPANTYSVASASTTGANYATSVDIVRLT